jgi:hypothetical protein
VHLHVYLFTFYFILLQVQHIETQSIKQDKENNFSYNRYDNPKMTMSYLTADSM